MSQTAPEYPRHADAATELLPVPETLLERSRHADGAMGPLPVSDSLLESSRHIDAAIEPLPVPQTALESSRNVDAAIEALPEHDGTPQVVIDPGPRLEVLDASHAESLPLPGDVELPNANGNGHASPLRAPASMAPNGAHPAGPASPSASCLQHDADGLPHEGERDSESLPALPLESPVVVNDALISQDDASPTGASMGAEQRHNGDFEQLDFPRDPTPESPKRAMTAPPPTSPGLRTLFQIGAVPVRPTPLADRPSGFPTMLKEGRQSSRLWYRKRMTQVCEHRSIEYNFRAVFLLADDEEGCAFMADMLSACAQPDFGGAVSSSATPNGDGDSPAAENEGGRGRLTTERSRVLVPCGDDSAALVALQRLGPVEALNAVRRRTRRMPHASQPARPRGQAGRSFSPVLGLPELPNRLSARSTLLVYVVRATSSALDVERQMAPIYEVEGTYAAGADSEFVPMRMLVVLGESSASGEFKQEEEDRRAEFAREVTSLLGDRGFADIEVVTLPCGDQEALTNLSSHIAEMLTDSLEDMGVTSPRLPGAGVPTRLRLDSTLGGTSSWPMFDSDVEAVSPTRRHPPEEERDVCEEVCINGREFVLASEEIRYAQGAALWCPGTPMTMITSDHLGAPLMCPFGDLGQGLVSLKRTEEYNVRPAFWQPATPVPQAPMVTMPQPDAPESAAVAMSNGGPHADVGVRSASPSRDEVASSSIAEAPADEAPPLGTQPPESGEGPRRRRGHCTVS